MHRPKFPPTKFKTLNTALRVAQCFLTQVLVRQDDSEGAIALNTVTRRESASDPSQRSGAAEFLALALKEH